MKTDSDAELLGSDYDMQIKMEVKSRAQEEGLVKHFSQQIKSEPSICSNHSKMNIKIKIEEQTLAPDFGSQNDRDFFLKNAAMRTNINALVPDSDCDITNEMKSKSEAPFADFCVQKEEEFLPKNTVKVKKYSSGQQMDSKMEIKEECWWLETETSSVCDEVMDQDFLPANFSRSYVEAISNDSDKSSLHSAEYLHKDVNLCMGKNSPAYGHSKDQVSDVTGKVSVEKTIHLEEVSTQNDVKKYNKASYLKHEVRRSHICKVCEKTFSRFSYLKLHNLIHDGKKPHKCEICDKRFTFLSNFKRHSLIHEEKKQHKCAVCEKRFTLLSVLKKHNLIHEGKKPYKCEICDKQFTQWSGLKWHILIHEGEKPHKCATCEKTFSRLLDLKFHKLIHEGKKPHKCLLCDKRFIQLSSLKRHNLIHEGKLAHKCDICEKRFPCLSYLKSHHLIHEGKKPLRCEICGKRFTLLSHLKMHKLSHESVKSSSL